VDEIKDAAWFYSSLAQSAASIVGIVGAVFLTRVTDHRGRMVEEGHSLAGELVQYGETFAKAATDYTDAATLAMQRPPTTPADNQAVGEGATALSLLTGRVEPKRMAAIERRLTECERQAPGAWAKGELHQKAEYLSLLRRKVESFRARALPRTLIAVWVLLAWLSVFGVLWPLAVLPALPQIGVSKRLILTLFGAGVGGFVVYLAYELWELRRLGQFDWRKR
jgi:hypothetical protein